MSYPYGQVSLADQTPAAESVPLFGERSRRLDISLLLETALVTFAAILAIKFLGQITLFGAGWFMAPAILLAAALVPPATRRGELPAFGLGTKQMKLSLLLVCKIAAVVFPLTFCVIWLLKFCGLELPLRPVLPHDKSWLCWLLYQFMYVAVAEEVFFRGYVQSNIQKLTKAFGSERPGWGQWTSIVLSAACFAIAHMTVHAQAISILTFLPGLVLGWLFTRTGSLLAPILFHGLANACYCAADGILWLTYPYLPMP